MPVYISDLFSPYSIFQPLKFTDQSPQLKSKSDGTYFIVVSRLWSSFSSLLDHPIVLIFVNAV